MKTVSRIFAAMLLTLATAAKATPVTVTFNEIVGGVQAFQTYTSMGYEFTVNNNGAIYGVDGAGCNPGCAANGTRTLLAAGPNFGYGNVVTMSRDGGGTFMLASMDAAEMFNNPGTINQAKTINYVGSLGGSTVMSGR